MLSWLGFRSDASRHGPGSFDVILSRSGGGSKVLRLNIIYLRRLLLLIGLIVFVVLSSISYILFNHYLIRHQLAQLDQTKKNIAMLAQEHKKQLANEQAALVEFEQLSTRLQTLESKLNVLKARDQTVLSASDKTKQIAANMDSGGQGGIANDVSGKELKSWILNHGEQQLNLLQEEIAKHAAMPRGVPVDMEKAHLSSRFGFRPNPFTGHGAEFHNGLDFAAGYGANIYAPADGVIEYAGPMGGLGNAVKINHGYDFKTAYGHMSRVLVKVGDRVKAGDLIGLVGSTGRSSGPHLHYIVYFQDQAIDPLPFV